MKDMADYTLGDFVALDPGIDSSGVAVFRAGRLFAVTSVTADKGDGDECGRAMRMGAAVAQYLLSVGAKPRSMVVEWMDSYPGKTPNPNSLLYPSAVSGASVAFVQACMKDDYVLRVQSVKPKEWVKGTSKVKTKKGLYDSSRSKRVLKRLEGDELLFLSDSKGGQINHDAIDAIAIGLHVLGRFEPVRVYSRG